MGGAFSGRNDYATTPTVEACRSLDVNWLHRQGCLDAGASGSIQWSEGGEQVASLRYRTVGDGGSRRVILSYTMVDGRTDDSERHEYPIPIETTACNFGGERPWFRCPGVINGEHCDRRVGKLYRPPRGDLYLCRHCYDLGYRSSRESGDPIQKALRRFQRAQENLGVGPSTPESGSYEDLYPDRPTGMHHSTYEEHMTELDRARNEWYAAFMSKMQTMTDRLRE
jgi:hypothetical protein